MIQLAELRVYGLNDKWVHASTKETALELIRILHRNILYHDSRWHFFWEGKYTVIRCDPQYLPVVKQLLEANDEDFECVETVGGYQENIEMTKRYLEAFVPIFHGFSLLAVEMEDEDFMGILERINHCYLNMATRKVLVDQFRIPGDLAETHLGMGWEALAIQAVAHMRSYTAGWYNR
ncbi:MAG: hypothetical protein KAR39_04585 [Thermoplasmata archaeon]|nr:hypothetical protein [Thermoplasmata archaeon]